MVAEKLPIPATGVLQGSAASGLAAVIKPSAVGPMGALPVQLDPTLAPAVIGLGLVGSNVVGKDVSKFVEMAFGALVFKKLIS